MSIEMFGIVKFAGLLILAVAWFAYERRLMRAKAKSMHSAEKEKGC